MRWNLGRSSAAVPDPVPKLGARLALTRRALDLTRFQMAQLLGTDMPTWGTYEDGLVRMPPDEALKLAPHGIPLNWIYEGKMMNCPPHSRNNSGIAALRASPAESSWA